MEHEEEYFKWIQHFWKTHEVSWRDIMTYHKGKFERDVAKSVDYYNPRSE